MAATLIPAPAPGLPHLLRLPHPEQSSVLLLDAVRYGLDETDLQGGLELEAGDWILRTSELRQLQELLHRRGLQLQRVLARCPETLVSAAGLGLATGDITTADQPPSRLEAEHTARALERAPTELQIHRGTLRAGDHLQSEGSLLLLGDLNPGARISAAGHVLVWGRLRGVAHAGCLGDREARIVALQLRPLQLRIADAVARGPAEAPAPGQAEEARLVAGEIRIDPASPRWPLHP